MGLAAAFVAVVVMMGVLLSRSDPPHDSTVVAATAGEAAATFHVTGTYEGPSQYTMATYRCEMVDTIWDATVSVSNGETWQYHNEYCGTVTDGEFDGAGPFSFSVPNGDRLLGTRRVTHAPYPGTGGGFNELHITGGTGEYHGASGSCVMDNHHEDFENGRQRQWGTLDCDISAPARANSPGHDPSARHLDGSYDGRSNFTLFTSRCEMVDTVWDATVAVSNGETWQYHNDYCGTVIDDTFNGSGTFTFTEANSDMLTGTTTTIDVAVPDPGGKGGAGGPTYLSITNGTGAYAGATGWCVLDNHVHNSIDEVFGHQRQWGTFECEITAAGVGNSITTSTTEPEPVTTTTIPITTSTTEPEPVTTTIPITTSTATTEPSSTTDPDPTTTSAAEPDSATS